MQYTMPPRTSESIGPSSMQYQQSLEPEQPQVSNSKPGLAVMKRFLTLKATFLGTGVILLTMLCIVPIWNGAALMSDWNYVFWEGRYTPAWMIGLCVGIVLLYTVTVFLFFSYTHSLVQTEQTIMMLANIFITLLGLTLMLLSLPLTRQSVATYTNLMHKCDYAEQTHRLYEYSQVLQNIRATTACADKYSVEECDGYEDAAPYTSFLKYLESNFHCAGFCYNPSTTLTQANASYNLKGAAPGQSYCSGEWTFSGSTADLLECQARCTEDDNCKYFSFWATGKAHWCRTTPACESLQKDGNHVIWVYQKETQPFTRSWGFAQESASPSAREHRSGRRKHVDHATNLALLATDRKEEAELSKTYAYPPTLFSDANYQASCDGMAARDMKNFVGDIGYQTFYQGIYLVIIAIATGFLKLIGFCVRKNEEIKANR